MKMIPGFECHDCGKGLTFLVGRLPDCLLGEARCFDALWQVHPTEYHEIVIHGRRA